MTIDFDSNVTASHCVTFSAGLGLLREGDVAQALCYFRRAYREAPKADFFHNKYASYYGLTRVLCDDTGGIDQCRLSAHREALDGDVFLNLAYAEWYMGNRRRAVEALNRGLELDPGHPGLHRLQQRLGDRRFTAFEFIPRNSFLNQALGKLSRKKSPQLDWNYWQLM